MKLSKKNKEKLFVIIESMNLSIDFDLDRDMEYFYSIIKKEKFDIKKIKKIMRSMMINNLKLTAKICDLYYLVNELI